MKFTSRILLLIIVCMCLSGCARKETNTYKDNLDKENVTNVYSLTKEDQRIEMDSTKIYNEIDLNGIKESVLVLNNPGDYVLTGTYYGQIYIAIDDDEVIHLFMDNANIYSKCGPAVYVESADKLVMTMLLDTKNILSDSANYKGYEEQNSSIYCNADITFNGTGSLNVYGYYNDAIKSKGHIKVVDGCIQVRSKDIGIRANDGILMSNCNLDIQSEGSGVYTKNGDKEGKGVVEITSGNISIISGKNAIYAASDVHIFDGIVYLNSVEEKIKALGEQYIKEGCLQ